MNTSKITDAQLNCLLANHLEPVLQRATDYVNAWGWGKGTTCWRTDWSDNGRVPEWFPRDLLNTGNVLMALLDRAGFVSLDRIDEEEDGPYVAVFCGAKTHSIDCGVQMGKAVARTPGRAIVLAFLTAEGVL